MKNILLIIIFSIFALNSYSQTFTDNGSIKYKVQMSGVDNPQLEQMFQDAGMEMGFFKGKYRMEMKMPMSHIRGYSVGDSMLMLMDMMGNKMKMMTGKDYRDSKKLNEADYEVIETKETKKIAGYNTKKYIIKTKDNQSYTVYTTTELPSMLAEYTPYTKLKGAPLEYETMQSTYKLTMTAESVKIGGETEAMYKYDDTGYTRMTTEQMMKSMMGGSQK